MAMGDGQKEILVLAEEGLYAANDHSTIGIANFFGDHADGEGPLIAQVASEEIGLVVQLPRGSKNPVLGALWDCLGRGRVVEHGGNCSLGKPNMLREFLHCNNSICYAATLSAFLLGCASPHSFSIES